MNVAFPYVSTVPTIKPAGLRVRPPGRAPEVTDHVKGAEPPDARNPTPYEAPTVVEGRLEFTMLKAGAEATVTVSFPDDPLSLASPE